MTYLKRLLFLLACCCTAFTTLQAQDDSCSLRISLLTCAPGDELYSIFGHTAIRVKDESRGVDAVFNYGTFSFGPDFYPQFVRGKLNYYLSAEDFNSFMASYQQESRSVWEQVLQLDCEGRERLFSALQTNALPQNRYYRYDFLYDNCTTRARDIIARYSPRSLQLSNVLPVDTPTFRNLIHQKLDSGHMAWSKLGIDLLLGEGLDRKVTNVQAMFLPDNLMRGLEGARAVGRRLVSPAQTILELPSPLADNYTPFTPLLLFSLLFGLLTVLSLLPHAGARRAIAFFDAAFFLLLGSIGVVLLIMWFGTEHALCANNWNLLWALPTHLAAFPFLSSQKQWVNNYLLATIVIQTILLIGWIFLPQELNLGFLPVVLIVLLRSWLIILKPHHGTTKVSV